LAYTLSFIDRVDVFCGLEQYVNTFIQRAEFCPLIARCGSFTLSRAAQTAEENNDVAVAVKTRQQRMGH